MRALAQETLDSAYEILGEAATYTQVIGGMTQAPVSVTVQPVTREVIDQPFDQPRVKTDTMFRVRKSEIAEPVQGGIITFNDIEWTITAKPRLRDERGLEWELGCGRKARPNQ